MLGPPPSAAAATNTATRSAGALERSQFRILEGSHVHDVVVSVRWVTRTAVKERSSVVTITETGECSSVVSRIVLLRGHDAILGIVCAGDGSGDF